MSIINHGQKMYILGLKYALGMIKLKGLNSIEDIEAKIKIEEDMLKIEEIEKERIVV